MLIKLFYAIIQFAKEVKRNVNTNTKIMQHWTMNGKHVYECIYKIVYLTCIITVCSVYKYIKVT